MSETKRVIVYVPEELHKIVALMANEEGRKTSNFICQLLKNEAYSRGYLQPTSFKGSINPVHAPVKTGTTTSNTDETATDVADDSTETNADESTDVTNDADETTTDNTDDSIESQVSDKTETDSQEETAETPKEENETNGSTDDSKSSETSDSNVQKNNFCNS